MGISESRVRQIIREELTRGSKLHEGFFDTVKSFFGGKSRGEEAVKHFTTENPIWPKMQAKLKKDKGTRASVRKNLGASGGVGNKEAYDKYIPSEWQKSKEDIEIYRNAMREVMLKYIDEVYAKEESEGEKSRRESESREQEREAAKRWLYDRNIVDKVMGQFGMQSDLRNQTTSLCFQIYLTYFRNGIKNPHSDDIIDDAVQLIDDSRGTYTSRVDDRVLARALARTQSLNPKR